MAEPEFDLKGIFDDDYLYFYAERVGDAHSDADVDLIWRIGNLEPDMDVLDLACGHGRIANRLAQRGCRVTGLDAASAFLDRGTCRCRRPRGRGGLRPGRHARPAVERPVR